MRLTLIGVASKYVHQCLAPWCLKAGLDQYGVYEPCQVLELNINQPFHQALSSIMKTTPDLIGFSTYIWNIQYIRNLIDSIKLLSPNTVIVLGGPEAGSRPDGILTEIAKADFVISGPGEYAFSELVRRLSQRLDVKDIPGLSLRSNGEVIMNRPMPLPLEQPSPYTKECIDALHGRIVYLETSRGCPYRCSFCLSGLESSVTFIPLEQAKQQLLLLAKSGAKTIKLVDRTFNCHKERAYEIIRFLIEKHLDGTIGNVCFHFEIAADLFDEATLQLLKHAPTGLFQMEAGLQSFHAKTLEACQRKTDIDKLSKNIAFLISGGNVHLHLDLIAGLPYEDFDTFGKSVDQALALAPHMLQLGFLKLLHGSRLRDQAQEFGILSTPFPPYEILTTKWLSFEDIQKLKQCEEALDRLYNSGKFNRTMNLVFQSSISPFHFFCIMGEILCKIQGSLSLDQCAKLAFDFIKTLPGISMPALRDAMVMDRIATDNTGYIPPFLAITDTRLGSAVNGLRQIYPPGKKLGACILYEGGERLFWTDYANRHPVTQEYAVYSKPLV